MQRKCLHCEQFSIRRKALAFIENNMSKDSSTSSFLQYRDPPRRTSESDNDSPGCEECKSRRNSLSEELGEVSESNAEASSSNPLSLDADTDCVVSALLQLSTFNRGNEGVQMAIKEVSGGLDGEQSEQGVMPECVHNCDSFNGDHSYTISRHSAAAAAAAASGGEESPMCLATSECATQTTQPDVCKNNMATQVGGTGILGIIRNDNDMKAFTEVSGKILDVLEETADLVLTENPTLRLPGSSCSLRERIVLTLCKLKLGLSFICLGAMSGVSDRTAQHYFVNMIVVLACSLKVAVYWPTKEEILANIPTCFKNYSQTRIVLDCTEVKVQKPKCLTCRCHLYSHYKGYHSVKVCVGITPCGLISWVSDAYGGKASDKAIVKASNILDRLIPKVDAVMVDQGFMIEILCREKNLDLIWPPFASSTQQMSAADAIRTRAIAGARVHVERAIQRMKIFKILEHTLPLTIAPYIDCIVTVIAGLVNLSPPILSDERFLPETDTTQ